MFEAPYIRRHHLPVHKKEMSVLLAHPSAKIPSRKSHSAAGFDLSTVESHTLQPGERRCFSTGVRVSCPDGTYARIAPRSGLALHHGIDVLAGVVDPDYTGIVGIVLVNLSDRAFTVNVGDRIAQLIFERYDPLENRCMLHAIFDDIDQPASGRGRDGFGSTGV